MKRSLPFVILFFLTGALSSQDLTYTVINTSTGGSTGSIDLNVSGGVAPYTFSWTGPAGFTANTEDLGSLPYGTYIVTVTDKYCGTATIAVFVDNDVASSVDEISGNSIDIFPNPSNGLVNVSSRNMLDDAVFELADMSGRTMIKQTGLSGNAFGFDISALADGIYFIELHNQGGTTRMRIIKN